MPASGLKAMGCIIATPPSARMREVFSSIVDAVSGSNWSYLIVFSIAMLDALLACKIPIIEVHLSNPYAREAFRRQSLMAPVSRGGIHGFGAHGYLLALDAAARLCGGTNAADSPEKEKQGIQNGQSQRRH